MAAFSNFRRLAVEKLEDRECPAVFNIANGDVVGLNAAIQTANTNAQTDTINLAANGTYNFTNSVVTNVGGNATRVITADGGRLLTINGNGADLVGLDERQLAAAAQAARKGGRRHPAGGAAADDDDAGTWCGHGKGLFKDCRTQPQRHRGAA